MPRPDYRIDSFRIGPMDNFGYLLIDEASGRAATVDPAWDAAVITARAEALGVRIDTVLLTHTHHDHVSAIDAFMAHPVHLAAAEAPAWPDTPAHATLHEDGDVLSLGQTRVTWRVTPGHSPGSSRGRAHVDDHRPAAQRPPQATRQPRALHASLGFRAQVGSP